MAKVINQKITNTYALYNGDCIELIKDIPDESVGFSIFSPPFASLFTYSNSKRDMGNSTTYAEFWEHFSFLVADLYRVMKPGRSVAIHCMNIPKTITHEGVIGLRDFRGDIIRAFESEGFIYHSEVCIWKDPLLQAVRTKTLTLAHKQISKDSSRCAQGIPDYLVIMRKDGENKEPISHGRGFEYYVGEKAEPTEKKLDDARVNKYSHKVWQRYASPVWLDIRQTRTLNYTAGRSEKDEKHICPLQLDVIERALLLWSNEGDTVLSPFAGVGSELYVSVKMGRKAIGFELKESYYKQALKNLRAVSRKNKGLELEA